MSRISQFNSPFLLGFDHFEQLLDRVAKSAADGYPPYNIERAENGELRITVAVAGFRKEELGLTLEANQLIIRGRQDGDPDRSYLHRGIAARQFQRTFVLADGMEVASAELDNGLLHVDLIPPSPESEVRTIEIRGPGEARQTAGANRVLSKLE